MFPIFRLAPSRGLFNTSPRMGKIDFMARRLRFFRSGLAVVVLVALASFSVTPAFAAPLLQTDDNQPTYAWLVVLAIILAAVAIQLLIEVFWNYLEWLLLNMGKWQPLQLRAPAYRQFKSGTSLLFGALLGVLVANFTGMRLFEYLQPFVPAFVSAVPQAIDVLITGLLIGAITAPVHDLFGLLTQFRNMAASNALKQRELAADALANAVLKLAQSEAQATVDVPGIGLTHLPTASADGDTNNAAGVEKSATERQIDLLHNRTSI